jgi:putative PIN family toxin of toxin-antitoxin system
MKVLLDTNIWISGLLWGGKPRQIIQLWQQKRILLYSSQVLLEELAATLAYPKLQRRLKKLEITAEELLKEVSQIITLTQPVSLSNISKLRDSKDKIVLEAAVSVPVDVIVSGDEDLLVLEQFQNIPIVTVKDFLENYRF